MAGARATPSFTGSVRSTVQPPAMEDRSLIRVGAAFGLVGAVIATVANLLHPRTPEDADAIWFGVIADSGVWDFVHFLIGVAILFVLAGLVALARYVRGTPGAGWGAITLIIGIAGASVALVHTAIDGYAFKHVAERWSAAGRPGDGPAYELVQTMDAISGGLFNAFNGTLLGVVPLLGGIAALRSGLFAGWVGIVAIIGGAIGVALDVYGTLGGELTPFVSNAVLTAGALLATIWAIVINWTMFNAAAEPAEVVEARTA